MVLVVDVVVVIVVAIELQVSYIMLRQICVHGRRLHSALKARLGGLFFS